VDGALGSGCGVLVWAKESPLASNSVAVLNINFFITGLLFRRAFFKGKKPYDKAAALVKKW
jgi:hypothetical protein